MKIMTLYTFHQYKSLGTFLYIFKLVQPIGAQYNHGTTRVLPTLLGSSTLDPQPITFNLDKNQIEFERLWSLLSHSELVFKIEVQVPARAQNFTGAELVRRLK